eukprot:6418965-Prymnesium_polylepis.1
MDALQSDAPSADAPGADEPPPRPPFNLLDSVFTPRLYTSDASSPFITDEVTLRGFQIDWGRCNTHDFQVTAGLYDDDAVGLARVTAELTQRVHHVLRRHRQQLYCIFAIFAGVSSKLHSMTTRGYFAT